MSYNECLRCPLKLWIDFRHRPVTSINHWRETAVPMAKYYQQQRNSEVLQDKCVASICCWVAIATLRYCIQLSGHLREYPFTNKCLPWLFLLSIHGFISCGHVLAEQERFEQVNLWILIKRFIRSQHLRDDTLNPQKDHEFQLVRKEACIPCCTKES